MLLSVFICIVLFFYYTQLHAQYYCVRPGHDSHCWDHTLLLSKRAQSGKHCYCRWPGPVAAVIQWNCTNIKAKSFLPGNSWNVLFLPRSLVSLCLPLTWQVFGSATLRLMVPSFGSMQISSLSCPPKPRSHNVGLIVIFLLLFLSRPSQMLTVTQLELFREAKNGTAAFLSLSLSYPPPHPPYFLCVKNDTSLSLCICITCLLPGNRGQGGQLWRDDLVWI